jgi:Flp pilus assembly protein TadG
MHAARHASATPSTFDAPGRANARLEDGNTSIENLIWMPLVFVVIFTIINVGFWYHAQNTARSIANSVVQVARIDGGSEAAGQAEASARLAQISEDVIEEPSVSITRGTDQASVTVTGRVRSLIPGLTFPVRQTATGPTERFVE